LLPHNPGNIGDAEADNDDGYGGHVGAGEPDILPALKDRVCARLQISPKASWIPNSLNFVEIRGPDVHAVAATDDGMFVTRIAGGFYEHHAVSFNDRSICRTYCLQQAATP
jgi:hypothetical protein